MLSPRLFASSRRVQVHASIAALRRSPLSAAVRRLLVGGATFACVAALPAFAQEQPAPVQQQAPAQTNPSVSTLDEIKVVGYQASLGKALNVKRNADAIVDAISAEDIGKFPDTNVAESLSRLSGITVDRQFGEGEKVSILGTDPALNRVLLNGQTIASTSWGGDPNDPDSRSFNYSTLAPEVVGLMEVYKTPEARIDEGSIGGTVIVHTRRPLDLERNTLTGTVSYGYNDRSEEGKPNASALYSWKNQDETLGVLTSVMHSQRVLRRDGVEIFGYDDVAGAGFPPGVVGNNTGVFPTSINTALFQQTRKRDGVSAALQWKPDADFELNLTGLYVKESFDNYNQSRYGYWGSNPGDAQALGFENGVATSGTFGDQSTTFLDGYLRNSDVTTGSIHLRADWHGDGWNASSQVGYTSSQGGAERIYGIQFRNLAGYGYNIDGAAPRWTTAPTPPTQRRCSSTTPRPAIARSTTRSVTCSWTSTMRWSGGRSPRSSPASSSPTTPPGNRPTAAPGHRTMAARWPISRRASRHRATWTACPPAPTCSAGPPLIAAPSASTSAAWKAMTGCRSATPATTASKNRTAPGSCRATSPARAIAAISACATCIRATPPMVSATHRAAATHRSTFSAATANGCRPSTSPTTFATICCCALPPPRSLRGRAIPT
ncbi:hypothetical protein FHR49_003166 [Xanthomonas campestris]